MNIFLNLLGDYGYSYLDFNLKGFSFILLVLLFVLVLNWFFQKEPISFQLNKNLELENYSLSFRDKVIGNQSQINIKKPSIITKTIVWLLSIILILVPFYELIETLRPDTYSNWIRFMFW